MRVSLKWLTPVLLRLLSLSHVSLGGVAAAALSNPGSVQLVSGFYVGLAATPQPQPDLSLDKTTTYVQLANYESAFPIMPLHLLGKKSWNVYNTDNIAKVKRDEAIAAAEEAAEDERLQEIDSERRLQILRGERLTPLAIEDIKEEVSQANPDRPSRDRKKRKRANEDDTDYELRIARDQTRPSPPLPQRRESAAANTPLTDRSGHIDLFPHSAASAPNPEAAAEAARKKKEIEDQYTLRFSNAGGLKTNLATDPWYFSPASAGSSASTLPLLESSRHRGGRNEKGDRKGLAAGDPLGMMRWGATEVRRVEEERRHWVSEREKEEKLEFLGERRETERDGHRHRDRKRVKTKRYEEEVESSSADRRESKRKESGRHGHKHHEDRKDKTERTPRREKHTHKDRSRKGETEKRHRESRDRHTHSHRHQSRE